MEKTNNINISLTENELEILLDLLLRNKNNLKKEIANISNQVFYNIDILKSKINYLEITNILYDKFADSLDDGCDL